MHYLYLITRDDGEKYVGVTGNIKRRAWEHKNGFGNKNLHNQEFTIKALDWDEDESIIYDMESMAIEEYNCTLNIAKGGHGGWNHDQKGENNPQAKLSSNDVIKIRELASNTKLKYSEIAALFDIQQSTVSSIASGKTWAHVGGPITIDRSNEFRGLSQKTNLQLINKAIILRNEGLSFQTIATKLGISASTVHKYCKDCVPPKNYQTHKTISENVKLEIVKMRIAGSSYNKIADTLKISSGTAYKYGKVV